MKLRFWNKAKPAPTPEQGKALTYIVKTMPNRTLGIDLKTWWDAIMKAKDVNFPAWYLLQEVYDKCMYDGRLYAVIQKRKLAMLNLDLVYKVGEELSEIETKFVKSPSFYRLQSVILDTIFRGYTLAQLFNHGGVLAFDIIPREYVQPVLKQILKSKTNFTGEPIENYPNMLFIGDGQDLGVLSVAAQYAIYKRNGFADFGQYIERYGQPIQTVTYEGNDPNARSQIQNSIDNFGSGATFEVPKGLAVDFKQGASSSNNDLFTQFLQSNNDELTILILGQLMTTEKGANYQAEVQHNVEESIFAADRVWMLNVLNTQVKPMLVSMFGFNASGEFMFEETERKDRKVLIEEDKLLSELIPLNSNELYEKYGVQRPEAIV